MIIFEGDMWTLPGLKVVTTNSYISRNKELVMGRGAALEAKQRYPVLPHIAGKYIKHLSDYGFICLPVSNLPTSVDIGLFQVKRHWAVSASLELIQLATNTLFVFIAMYKGQIIMNYPGIGNGKLTEDAVYPIISRLPDTVIVCKKG